MSRALIIVDVQNDFAEGGALGVTGGERVARGISDLLGAHRSHYSYVLASRDWHDAQGDNGGHFASEPDFVDTWPPHCIAGTRGAEYHDTITDEAIDFHVRKGQGRPAYSVYEGTTEESGSVPELLDRLGIDRLDIAGLATDYCVRATVLDAIEHGLHVRVITDLVAGVNAESSAAALAEMAHSGAELIESRMVPASGASS